MFPKKIQYVKINNDYLYIQKIWFDMLTKKDATKLEKWWNQNWLSLTKNKFYRTQKSLTNPRYYCIYQYSKIEETHGP